MSEARALLDSGDVAGLIRHLRFNSDGMELAEVAQLVADAAALSGFDDLRDAAAALAPWPARYLLAYNALLAGDIGRAERASEQLPAPAAEWRSAADRLARMIARARAAQGVSPLDDTDLRGWHFALTGGLLMSISPYGFHDGMTGRFAFMSDSFAMCRRSLDRLRRVLEVTGRRPTSVGLLPDRSSRILGLAAAQLFGLPAEPFDPRRPDALVVAYSLSETEPDSLLERVDGQVLFEHSSCWTDPPAVSADAVGVLHQFSQSPWDRRMTVSPDGEPETVAADDRAENELADEILATAPDSFESDDDAPPDPDEVLTGLASAVGGHWLTGPRDMVHSPGPVPSNRFA
ncbi:hypothetical protein [Mycolicibacterium neworleansense]|uniref:hypothetical protein n=1 Tax=Mycolicibacterium neworleansense TaxID=146018 RepID=UPI001C65A414|nr:hypothetical protein [Mycolicibacterium neworleansense]